MTDTTPLPDAIGPYRIVRRLGEGASGQVYLAQQLRPEREVALKVLRAAAMSSESRARFAREGRLLAQLEHPGIARLYAADVADTASGPLPYLAMEAVPGPDLLQHAAGRPLRERIELLIAVCRAVHFAHTRGIVHRDLKPANLLVDAHGAPKVLDFGVAHVMAADAATLVTRSGDVLGTLPYMSWEQLGGEPSALDPRSDVFALGVIGYELVCGERPYPPLPANERGSLTAALEQRRRVAPRRLSLLAAEARGDLETVLHKAMAFDAKDRYESATDLAGDLQRWLDSRPIEARPPTAAYVTARFIRRHRGLSAAIGLALVSLVAGAAVATIFGLSEAHARRQEVAARVEAESRSAELRAVNQFLEDALALPDPTQTRADGPHSLDGFLLATERVLATDRSVPPRVAAQVYKTLGSTYHALEQYPRALTLLDTAQHKLAAAGGAGAEPLLSLEIEALHAITVGAQGNADQAIARIQHVLAQLPPSTGDAQRLRMVIYGHYADLLLGRADYASVIALLDDVVDESKKTLGADDPYTMFNESRLAYAYRLSSELAQASALLAPLLERERRVLGPEHALTLSALNETGLIELQSGRPERAEPVLRELLAGNLVVYGANSMSTLAGRGNLLNALNGQQKWDEAEPLAREHYAVCIVVLGADSRPTLMAGRSLARVLEARGEVVEAEKLYRSAIEKMPAAVGAKHPEVFRSRNDYGRFLLEQHRDAEALRLLTALHAESQAIFGADNINTASYGVNLARASLAAGDRAAALQLLHAALPIQQRVYGSGHPQAIKTEQLLQQIETPDGGGAVP